MTIHHAHEANNKSGVGISHKKKGHIRTTIVLNI